jgi:hypothetical protein
MNKINVGKVILGGIVGGIAAGVIDWFLNEKLFSAYWATEAIKGLAKGPSAATIIPELLIDCGIALIGTILYALARPRLGGSAVSGLKMALLVGILVALPGGIGMLVWEDGGHGLWIPMLASSFLIPAVGTFFGAAVYKE